MNDKPIKRFFLMHLTMKLYYETKYDGRHIQFLNVESKWRLENKR